MTTKLDKTLKREIQVKGQAYIVALSPDGLKITIKGRRKGQELTWDSLVSGDASLSASLTASVHEHADADDEVEEEPEKEEA